MATSVLNGYQIRTEETKIKLLQAAEQVFSKRGFEAAQLHEIAATAGRSKGAIYTHYKSKDDLFLALFAKKNMKTTEEILDRLSSCSSRPEAIKVFKEAMLTAANDRTWILLTIEAKLYSLRHPEMHAQWQRANSSSLHRSNELKEQMQKASCLLFGNTQKHAEKEIQVRTSAIGPILESLVLESEFDPSGFSIENLRFLFDLLFDALLNA